MKLAEQISTRTDQELLAACLHGEREAFRALVERYQGTVSGQAYAICGDFGRSEDIAQEAFIAAWRQLPTLRDHTKFRAWLCGIARHLALRTVEKHRRESGSTVETAATHGHTPRDALVSREEQEIVWKALAELPEAYRTPLVLYYREHQSITAVAETLDLSEDAIKQRLSRGRALLRQQVASIVEHALGATRPGPAFAAGVIAVLAGSVPATATAGSSMIAAVAKGSTPVQAILSLPVLGGLLGAGLGFLGGWLGIKLSAESAAYEREKQEMLRSGKRMFVVICIFMVLQVAAMSVGFALKRVDLGAWLTLGVVVVYMGWIFAEVRRQRRRIMAIREEEEAAGVPRRQATGRWQRFARREGLDYRSRLSLFGLPLLHVALSGSTAKTGKPRTAMGWIAVGDRAVGFFATGGIAFGLFAMGGMAFGAFAFGGLGLGLVTLGGCAIGWWCYGGLGIGNVVHAGMALASELAFGGSAISREFAIGGVAVAPHANDAAAQAALANSAFLGLTAQPWFSVAVPLSVLVLFGGVGYLSVKLARCHAPADASASSQTEP
jgi:zinc protease